MALLLLPVVGAGAVFSFEVFVQELGLDGLEFGFELQRHQRHVSDTLDGDGDFDGFRNGRSPSEGSVAVDEHAGAVERINAFEAFDDHVAGLPFVSAVADFLGRHLPGDGNVAIKIVGMRRAEDRDDATGLGKRGGVRTVRVHDASDGFEREEEPAMRRRVGGRIEFSFDLLAFEIDEYHVVRLEHGVVHATRLDGEDALRAVDGAGVAEGEIDQPVFWQEQIGLIGLAFKFGEHGK